MKELPTSGQRNKRAPRKVAKKKGAIRSRRLLLALFSQSSKVTRAFASLSATDDVEVTRFDPERSSKSDWAGDVSYDAIIVEQSKVIDKDLVRRLRKSCPAVPLIAVGGGDVDPRSVYALHLNKVPRKGMLSSLVKDARRLLQASRKATTLSRRFRETARQLQVLEDIVSTANSLLEPRHVLNVIMSQIQELIPSEAWSILLVDEENGELRFEMALGEKSADLSDTRIKIGEGIAGWVAEAGEPIVVNDVRSDPRFQGRFDDLTHFRTRSILCAPLISRGRTIGVVEVMNRASGTRFTKKDMSLLMTLVEPAAIALENAILFQKSERLAVIDDLTKLYNSRYLNRFLEETIERAKKMGNGLAVLFLDLDGFKSINDRYGHLSGSRTLYEVGALIKGAVREEDVVSRYGGDEFVVVLPNTDSETALSVAERIRASLKSHVFLTDYGLEGRLSASFGVSLYPDQGQSPQDLIQKADQAMYSVKQQGKDAICVAS